MEVVAREVMINKNARSAVGRVVINRESPLELHDTLPMYLCCGRAFLSQTSYLQHKSEESVHGKPIDLTNIRTAINARSTIAFWKARKLNSAKKMDDEDDYYEEEEVGDEDLVGDDDWNEGDDGNMMPTKQVKKLKKPRRYKKCTLCSLDMPATNIPRHIRTCHNQEHEFKCNYCTCRFVAAYGRMIHEFKAHKLKTPKSMMIGSRKKLMSSAHYKSSKPTVARPVKKSIDAQLLKVGNKFQCSLCSKSFACSRTAQDHVNVHLGVKPFGCVHCGLKFTFKSSVGRHIKTCHVPDGEYFCPYNCGCVMANQISLNMHSKLCKKRQMAADEEQMPELVKVKVEIKQEKPQRKQILALVDTKLSLDLKSYRVAPNLYHCNICNKNITCSGNFRDHLNSHSGTKNHKCPLCHLEFTFRSNIKRHIKTSHVKNGLYVCENRCGCKFDSQIGLKSHLYTCRKKLGELLQLKKEPEARKIQAKFIPSLPKMVPKPPQFSPDITSSSSNSFECPTCGKVMISKRNLRNHMLIHLNLKPFKCQLCGFSFRAVESLKKHQERSHYPNGQYLCSDCPCKFNRTQGLIIHRKMYHSKTKNIIQTPMPTLKPRPNNAGFGNKITQNSLPLQSIKKETDFECHVCGKMLQSLFSLRNHGRIHSGAKPFKCQICGHKFRLASTLSDHKRSSHSGGSYNCEKCPCEFETEQGLQRHQGVFHGLRSPKYAQRRATSIKNKALKSQLPRSLPSLLPMYSNSPRISPEQRMPSSSPAKNSAQPYNRQSFKVETDDTDGMFQCGHCGVSLQTLQALSDHQRIHTQSSLETNSSQNADEVCHICSHKVYGPSHLKKHMISNHGGGDYPCCECPCEFYSQSSLSRHLTRYHGAEAETERVVIKVENTDNDFGFEVYDDEDEIQEIHFDKIPEGKYDDDIMEIDDDDDEIIQQGQYSQYYADDEEGIQQEEIDFDEDKIQEGEYYDDEDEHEEEDDILETAEADEDYKPSRPSKQNRRSSTSTTTKFKMTKPDNFQHTCDQCGKSFKHKYTYMEHLRIHQNTKPYKCTLCSQSFRISSILSNHKKKSHGNGKFRCKICTCRFATPKGLSVHHFVYHKGGRLEKWGTEAAKEESRDEEQMIDEVEDDQIMEEQGDFPDIQYEHNNGIYSTPVKMPPLQQPTLSKNSPKDRPIKCKECGETCLGPLKLQEHMDSHKSQPTECSGCGDFFESKEEFERHIKVNTGNPFRCAYCCITVTTAESLHEHFETFHSSEEENLEDPEVINSEATFLS